MPQITNRELYQELNNLRKELEEDDKSIERKMKELETKIDQTYTKLVEFQPVKRIVFGMVAVVLTGFLGTLLFFIGWSAR